MNVPEVDPLRHHVVGCRLIPTGTAPDAHRRALIDHHVWAMRRMTDSKERIERFFSEITLLRRTLPGTLQYLWRNLVLACQADLVVFSTPRATIEFPAAFAAGVLVRLRGGDCLLYSETWWSLEGWRNLLRRTALRATYWLATGVVVPGTRHAVIARRLVRRATPVRIVGSPYCDAPAPRPLVVQRPSLRVLYCGRIFPLKGLDLLVEAMHRLLLKGRDVRLTVVDMPQSQWAGRDPGYRQRCLDEARLCLGDRLDIVAPVRAIESLFADHDLLVMPNREVKGDRVPLESWGRILEEALTFGIPVVATDAVGAAYDLIVDGVNGFMPHRGDANALEAAIDRFLIPENAHAG